MGKIFVLSVTDHEEYILSRIMEIIAAEPGFDHIVSSHPCNTLVFPGLELRLKERTVHRNGELISMTHREFATLVYLANHPSWVFSAGQIYEEVWGEDGADTNLKFRKVWQNRTIKYILAAHIMKQPKAGNLYDGSPAFCFHKNSV